MICLETLSLRLRPPPPPANARTRRRQHIYLIAKASNSEKRCNDDYHSTLKALNSKGRIIPRKSLGQHYMLNSSMNDKLSSTAGVVNGDVVLEIGPGTGSLTDVLINSGATVFAVEKDSKMAMLVKERFDKSDKLTVMQGDITRCDIHSHVSPLLEKVGSKRVTKFAKVVSNIPFNISTDVVRQFLPMSDLFSEVILLLQHETAIRLAEFQLGSSEYRPINLFVNFYSDAEYICKVERTNFFPQPNVDAAIIKFKLKKESDYPQVTSRNEFFSMVNSAFSGKRKMLRKSLQHICSASKIEEALLSVGLQATARPQELTLKDFVRLYHLVSSPSAF